MGAERNHTRLTEQVTTLGSAERLLRSAPPPVRHVQCVTTASAGAVEVRLPGQPDGPVKFSKTQCEEEIMFQGAPFSFATVNILVMVVTVVTVITIPISAATTTVAMVMAAAIPTRRNKGAAAWPGDGPIIRSVMEACHEAILSRRVNADGYPALDRIDRLEGQLYQHVKAYMRPKTRERWCVRSMARITAELTSLYSAV